MADYVIFRKSRNILSTVLHNILNLILGVGSIYITYATDSWIIGVLLVIVSKWRIFAVRPRFWFVNLKSNLVDIIVGVSLVFLTYCTGPDLLPAHFMYAVIYVLWLLVLKSKSTEIATEIQAIIAIFLGTTATTLMTASADSIFLIVPIFIISYSASRHVLIQGEEHDFELVPIISGLCAAEVAWLCHSWLIVYSFSVSGIIIPQLSIIITVFSYLFGFVYKSILRNNGKLEWAEVTMPMVFTVLLISIIVLIFSNPIFNV